MTGKIYTQKDFENKLLSVREKLADLEHEQWSHWTKYFLNNIVDKEDGLIRLDLVQRWNEQTKSAYSTLSEKEKDSDRIWADKVLEVLRKEFEDLLYFATSSQLNKTGGNEQNKV
jgi:hypothetical protein